MCSWPTFKLKCALLFGLVLAFWKHKTESAREFSQLFWNRQYSIFSLSTRLLKTVQKFKKLDLISELAALFLLACLHDNELRQTHHTAVVNWHQVSRKRPVSPSLDAGAPGRQLCLSLSNHCAWASLFKRNTYSSEHLVWHCETLLFSDDIGQGVTVNGHCWFPLVLSLAWH